MKRKVMAGIVFFALILSTLACQLLESAPVSNPTSTAIAAVIAATVTSQPVEDMTVKTQAAEQAASATAWVKAQSATRTAVAKKTQAVETRLAKTVEAQAWATTSAQEMNLIVRQVKADGAIQSTDGTYYYIGDFEESWAQIDWYQWWNTGIAPDDFVIRAHTEWESASRTANWPNAGCGFVFRASDADNHYMIFLALDGNVYLRGYVDGKYREMGREYVGNIDFMEGSADVILAVQGSNISYYIDGERVFQRSNSELKKGDLALTLSSGTNKDFGTRCSMTDIEVWDLTP